MRKLVTLLLCVTCSVTPTNAQYWCSTFSGSVSDYDFVTAGGTVQDGTPCCFPFTYRGVTYTSCTSYKHSTTWCSVESVYDGRWGNCVNNTAVTNTPREADLQCSPASSRNFEFVTTGGSVAEGTPCCFPFVYNNVAYSECTSAGHSRPWCSVESVYKGGNKKWGNCVSVTNPTAYPGAPTPVPRTDFTCDAPATKSETWYTFGGNAPQGSACCFPFTFQGTEYSSCTYADHKQPWCAVTPTYESNYIWGNCMKMVSPTANPTPAGVYPCNTFLNSGRSSTSVTTGGTVPEGTPCCFPFVYNEVLYSECTSAGHNRPWCTADSIYTGNAKLWGNCVSRTAPSTAVPPTTPFECTEGEVSDRYFTRGGTVPEDSRCCFPFSYRAKTYFNCITVNHNQQWCSVDGKYNGRWGNCKETTIPADIKDGNGTSNNDDANNQLPYYPVPDEDSPYYEDPYEYEQEEEEQVEDPLLYPFPVPYDQSYNEEVAADNDYDPIPRPSH